MTHSGIPNDVLVASNLAVVIEAPGKAQAVAELYRSVGAERTRVISTRGRLLDLPEGELGVDARPPFSSIWRSASPGGAQRFVAEMKRTAYDHALIMTDDDEEGEMIAAQALSLMPEDTSWWRIRPRELTRAGLIRALSRGRYRQLDWQRIRAARSRRIFDRLAGYLPPLSSDAPKRHQGEIGRVITPLASSIASDALSRAIVSRPLADGWHVVMDVRTDQVTALASELCGLPDDGIRAGENAHATRPEPWNHDDAIRHLSLAQGIEPDDALESIQRLYEGGKVSYPRTSSRRWSPETLTQMRQLAAFMGQAGGRNGAEANGIASSVFDDGAHEALHPTVVSRFCAAPDGALHQDDRILNAIARHASACLSGRKRLHQTGLPDATASGKRWSEFQRRIQCGSAHLCWARDLQVSPGPLRDTYVDPFMDTWADSLAFTSSAGFPGARLLRLSPQQSVFLRLMTLGICRPSTIVGHAARLSSRLLTRGGYELGARGRAALAFSREHAPNLLSADASRSLLDVFANADMSESDRIRFALQISGIRSDGDKKGARTVTRGNDASYDFGSFGQP